MAEAPGPTVVRVQYHSAFGVHTQSLHTRDWTPVSSGHVLGQVPAWDGSGLRDVLDMTTDLLNVEAPWFPNTVSFDFITVLTQSSPTSVLVPMASASLTGIVGTDTAGGFDQAVQTTHSFRTAGNSNAKIVQLDSTSFNDFAPIRTVGSLTILTDLIAEFVDSANAWSGADNTQPLLWIGTFRDLNDALRRAYRMT